MKIKWSIIKIVTTSLFIRSYIFITALPIVAKFYIFLLDKEFIKEEVNFPTAFEISYFASLSIFISYLIYVCFSPELIKKTSGIDDYIKKYKNHFYLDKLMIRNKLEKHARVYCKDLDVNLSCKYRFIYKNLDSEINIYLILSSVFFLISMILFLISLLFGLINIIKVI